MPACLIGHITVKNPQRWAEYRSRVPATLAPWNAEVVFRGRRLATLSGAHDYDETVVIRFADARALESWHASPAYQALVPLRSEAAEVVLISYEA